MILFASTLHAQAELPTDKAFWHTEQTKASPSTIWAIWIDVSQWKKWDTGLQDAMMEESFSLGAKGKITTLEGRKVSFKVVDFEEGKSYTYKTSLPLGGLYVKRSWEERDGITYFTHRVWFKGITAGIFAKALGGDFRKMLPDVLANIKEIAEK